MLQGENDMSGHVQEADILARQIREIALAINRLAVAHERIAKVQERLANHADEDRA